MVDCCSAPGLMPFEQAKNKLLQSVAKVTETECISIEHADKRILCQDITSPIAVPGHNNSAMDGYAIRDDALDGRSDHLTSFSLVGASFAGKPFDGQLENGQSIRIMTGAVVPQSANAIIMQENVEQIHNDIGATITLSQPAKLNSNIRYAGEDIAKDQVVFQAGHQLKAVDIGLLASLGLPEVSVYRQLKVAVFSTGDELKQPGQTLSDGDIYESNSHVLVAMLQRLGVEVIPMGIIADTYQAINKAFIDADAIADAVISSGGVSVGEADYTKEVLDALGQIDFWKVAMKPGKPFAFGKLPNSVFFGLPGNPVSATVTFHQLALPALAVMAGKRTDKKLKLQAITSTAIKKKPGRMDFQRGIAAINDKGQLQVAALGAQGSGILSSISKANCYIILPQDNAGVAAGNLVEIELFDSVLD